MKLLRYAHGRVQRQARAADVRLLQRVQQGLANLEPVETWPLAENDSGVRWFELRRSGTGNWALHQEGTFSPGDTSTHHLIGVAAMDKFGNIGMGYNVTMLGDGQYQVALQLGQKREGAQQ
jgi:hypothetical protein